ncbi:hypothetical protein K3495_g14305 [Podosphaera aphanis]|nr:hypothetical protein K3495_g14305 [Podosphaera aphanis]
MYKENKELQTGRTIKAMRFDGGSEYKTIDFHGITRQISAPYTQHQNGVSERLNRTLITMARCMLSHAHLPLRFWDAAVLTACYLRNRLPILENNLTPFEAMNGHPAKISHLKVWGCVCYVLIDKTDPQRYKLKQTSLKGIFVGYCESITQYQVYIPSKPGTNKVIISANVKFQEESFWDWSESTQQILNEEDILSDTQQPTLEADSSTDSDHEGDFLSNPAVSPSQSPINLSDNISGGVEGTTVDTLEESSEQSENLENSTEPLESQVVPNIPINSQVPNVRRGSRQRKQIAPRSAWQPKPGALYVEKETYIPKNFSDATKGLDREKWQSAIDEELKSLKSKEVFIPVTHVPHGRKTIGSRWVFAIKSDGRFKARLVAQGFSQVYGIDYFDTYSPTLRMDSLRILLAVSAFFDWEIHQIDVKTAYLEGDLEEDVFMKCPEGVTGTKYVKVQKALYGLKQSGRAWYQKLDEKLSKLLFRKSDSDHCIYIHTKLQIIIGVYVDDLIICGKLLEHVVRFKQQLSAVFPIKDLGEIDVIIGWKVTRERTTRTLKISQAEYIRDKICSFGLQDAKIYTSPLNGYDGIMPGQRDEPLADESAYASAVGSLGYASNSTRPDVSFATSQLGSYNSCPVSRHWNSVCRVFRYLKGSMDYCITYSFGLPSGELLQTEKLTMYSDSDFAGDIVTRRSVSGYIVMLGGGPVCWQSRRQKSVSTSTAEAEYVALFEAAKQAIWVNQLITELHVENKLIGDEGILLFTDNQSALSIAGGTNSAKTKHIDVSYHFVRDCVRDKKINIKYIPTDMMLADLLTKPLSYGKAKLLCQQIFRTM